MEETRAVLGKYSFRLLPRTSVDFRCMCGRKTEDARWGIMRKTEKIGLNGRDLGGVGDIASVSFQGLPWASAAWVGGSWQMEAVRL